MKFFNDKKFEAVKVIWQKFYKRWNKNEKEDEKNRSRQSVERRSTDERSYGSDNFKYESSECYKIREAEYFKWIRVYGYDKEINEAQRREWQERIAGRIIKGHFIDRMLINYKD